MGETTQPISEVFCIVSDLCASRGGENIKELPGCFEIEIGKAFIAINGHEERTSVANQNYATVLPPYYAAVFWNGWAVYRGNALGGCVLMLTEDELIEKLNSLKEVKKV